mmetsp:Transcript_54459/g.99551  ORF Transcript_54459/g.99551 Transcript_54459/m.99551 type:complete len:92 (-) Transcript_54459:75-350(-)
MSWFKILDAIKIFDLQILRCLSSHISHALWVTQHAPYWQYILIGHATLSWPHIFLRAGSKIQCIATDFLAQYDFLEGGQGKGGGWCSKVFQ